jgi:hypothetical protein
MDSDSSSLMSSLATVSNAGHVDFNIDIVFQPEGTKRSSLKHFHKLVLAIETACRTISCECLSLGISTSLYRIRSGAESVWAVGKPDSITQEPAVCFVGAFSPTLRRKPWP